MACKTSQRFTGYPAFLKVPLKRHIVKCYCAIRMLEEILNILLKYHNPYKDSKLDKIYKLIISRNDFQKYDVTNNKNFKKHTEARLRKK